MEWDLVIVGSGFGGAMIAHRAIEAGAKVLMIERGDWVPRGEEAWKPEASLELTDSYAKDIPYRCLRGGHGSTIGGYACVGGPSVYYGCVAFRFREQDFEGDPDIVRDSNAAWPFRYSEIEPYYSEAEHLLGICGSDAGDETAPFRSSPYPFPPAPLAPLSQRVCDAAVGLGLSPFHLPLAINHVKTETRAACRVCRTCDTYACGIEAKNDIATMMIKPLIDRGMTLWTRAVVTRLETAGKRVHQLRVQYRTLENGDLVETTVRADRFVLAAGALGTPHLLLASEIDKLCPTGSAIGRYLMRHDNTMVFGFFPTRPDPGRRYHKQLAFHDWYFGDPFSTVAPELTKLGCIQQVMTPPKELVRAHLPLGTKTVLGAFTEQLTGLLCIAEDQPRRDNHVSVDHEQRDVYGLPQLVIDHTPSDRDRRANLTLVSRAKQLLRKTGALFFHSHHVKTFSHVVGTVRMGPDDSDAPLDHECRVRGLDNLWVTDGSALPMSAGVNPSLTIAANALRVGHSVVR
jgi:choline dehydrogenase-like flavoprotein